MTTNEDMTCRPASNGYGLLYQHTCGRVKAFNRPPTPGMICSLVDIQCGATEPGDWEPLYRATKAEAVPPAEMAVAALSLEADIALVRESLARFSSEPYGDLMVNADRAAVIAVGTLADSERLVSR